MLLTITDQLSSIFIELRGYFKINNNIHDSNETINKNNETIK